MEYLKSKGFTHYSARDFIRKEIEKKGLPVNRDTLIATGNEIRSLHSPSYIVDSLLAEAKEQGGDVVIESLRATKEAMSFKEKGAIVWGVDADPRIRYERAYLRGSETDHVSFEEWLLQEQQESNTEDETKQNIFGALRISNTVFQNNGTLEELHAQVDEALSKLI